MGSMRKQDIIVSLMQTIKDHIELVSGAGECPLEKLNQCDQIWVPTLLITSLGTSCNPLEPDALCNNTDMNSIKNAECTPRGNACGHCGARWSHTPTKYNPTHKTTD